MTLIELINKLRKKGNQYCAIDKNGQAWGYNNRPKLGTYDNCYQCWTGGPDGVNFLGQFDLIGDWKKTMFNVNDITL